MNKQRLLTTTGAGLIVFGLAITADAAILSYDLNTTGDGLVTRDTTSGLDWLDLTETVGSSYLTVKSQTSAGNVYEGWRFATQAEVVDLFSNFNIDLSFGADKQVAGKDPNVYSIASFVGDTFASYDGEEAHGVRGYTVDDGHATGYVLELAAYIIESEDNTRYIPADESLIPDDVEVDFVGSYLVQTSVVPVPAAVWLFGSGLVGLIGLARRKA